MTNTPLTGEIWHLSIDDLLAPLPETARLGGPGPFVINLSASTAPIALPDKGIAGCQHAKLYQVQRMEDRRPRYRLRLGPFADEDEAEAMLKTVREFYPGALTATADTDDLRAIANLRAKSEAPQASAEKAAEKPAVSAVPLLTTPVAAPSPTVVAKPAAAPPARATAPVSSAPPARAMPPVSAAPPDRAPPPVAAAPPARAMPLASAAPPARATPPAAAAPPARATPPAAAAPPARAMPPAAAAPPARAMPPAAAIPTAEQKIPVLRVSASIPTLNTPASSRQDDQLSRRLAGLETTQTVRALTQLELEDDNASRWFVIQLSVAEEPFDPDTVPNLDIFSVYRLYSVAGIDQGRIMHALRLGFFTEEIAAGAVASYLTDFYDKPTIKRVSAAERQRFAEQSLEPRKDIGATGRHSVIEITSERFVREKRNGAAAK
jgi:SPOR domain